MDYFNLSSNEISGNKKMNNLAGGNSLNNPKIMSIFLTSLKELQKEQKKKNNKKALNKFSLRSGIMNKTFNKEEVKVKEITINRSYDLTKRRKFKKGNFVQYNFEDEIESKQSLESNKVEEEIDNENSLNNSFVYNENEKKSMNSEYIGCKLNSNINKSKSAYQKEDFNDCNLDHNCINENKFNTSNKLIEFPNNENAFSSKRNFLIDNIYSNKEMYFNGIKKSKNKDSNILENSKNFDFDDDYINNNNFNKISIKKEPKSLGSFGDDEARKFLIKDLQKIVREIFKESKINSKKSNISPNELITSINSKNEEIYFYNFNDIYDKIVTSLKIYKKSTESIRNKIHRRNSWSFQINKNLLKLDNKFMSDKNYKLFKNKSLDFSSYDDKSSSINEIRNLDKILLRKLKDTLLTNQEYIMYDKKTKNEWSYNSKHSSNSELVYLNSIDKKNKIVYLKENLINELTSFIQSNYLSKTGTNGSSDKNQTPDSNVFHLKNNEDISVKKINNKFHPEEDVISLMKSPKRIYNNPPVTSKNQFAKKLNFKNLENSKIYTIEKINNENIKSLNCSWSNFKSINAIQNDINSIYKLRSYSLNNISKKRENFDMKIVVNRCFGLKLSRENK